MSGARRPVGALGAAVASFVAQPRLAELRGAVQHYAWGGTELIPRLLGEPNADGAPYAELWIGAHPKAPAVALLGEDSIGLDRLIGASPEAVLGAEDARRFGGHLPYLLKVLDVRAMLSIQAHPSLEQARKGFARENAAGIPLDDPRRTYVDDNHKPEIHAPLGDFWMLHGFRPLEEIAAAFRVTPELRRLLPMLEQGLRILYRHAMTMPQAEVDAILDPLLSRLERSERAGALPRGSGEYWALRASREFPLAGGHRDRGILSFWLLNLLHLGPGMGTFQAAGTLHAYLQGSTVELMASSDNVIRGGLTPKRVDAEGLLATLTFAGGKPDVLRPQTVSATEHVFEAPVEEFQLSRIEVAPGRAHFADSNHGVDCLVAIEGTVEAAGPSGSIGLPAGRILLAPAGVPYRLDHRDGSPAVLYRATVPRPRRRP